MPVGTEHAIVVALTVIIISLVLSRNKEAFDSRDIVATTQRLNFNNELKNYRIVSIPTTGWEYVLFRLNTRQSLRLYNRPSKVILDPLDYIEYGASYPSEELVAGYFFVLAKTNYFECGFNFNDRKVGYFDSSEKRLIDAIHFGYRTKGKSVQIGMDKIVNLDSIWESVDMLVVYIVPKSPLASLIEKQHLFVLDITNISIDRIRLKYPMVSLETIEKASMFSDNNRIVSPTSVISVFKMSMRMLTLRESKEQFITRLNLSAEYLDPNYKCVGMEEIHSNALCKSPYDVYGEKKKEPTLVDKACVNDSDCPFYKSNKNYPNNRGGCMKDGTCEMPIGVKRLGYTKYFDQPFCYQCQNSNDRFCCESQEAQVIRKQTRLKSPDYAFSNDREDRKNNGLPTYII